MAAGSVATRESAVVVFMIAPQQKLLVLEHQTLDFPETGGVNPSVVSQRDGVKPILALALR
jgi:hypothetical protein